MADTMQFDLVSPERMLTSVQASQVQIPGSEGDLSAMPDHTPTITTLRPGILRVQGPAGDAEFLVTGGFAEITSNGISVLAEHAVPREEANQELLDQLLVEANEAKTSASPETLDAATKTVADLAMVAQELGLSVQ